MPILIEAYAAVVYLILKTETKSLVQFVAAKTRVTPLKTQTIPRLELLSTLFLSRLIVSVHSSLQHQIPSLGIKCLQIPKWLSIGSLEVTKNRNDLFKLSHRNM